MDKRNGFRVQTGDDVVFVTQNVMKRGKMNNLSSLGCHVLYDDLPANPGEKVEITLLQGVTVPGIVAWRDEGEFGVRFERALGEATVRYFRLGDWCATPQGQPIDGFGRTLPPLATDNWRRNPSGAE